MCKLGQAMEKYLAWQNCGSLVEFVRGVGAYLSGQARRHAEFPKAGSPCDHRFDTSDSFCEKCGLLRRVYRTQVARVVITPWQPGRGGAALSCEYEWWPERTFLRFLRTEMTPNGAQRESALLFIRIHFGPRQDAERAIHKRAMRQPFRLAGSLRDRQAICLDQETRKTELEEQLGIHLIRNGVTDGTIESLLLVNRRPSSIEDAIKQKINLKLIEEFTDPDHPRSYSACRRLYRGVIWRQFIENRKLMPPNQDQNESADQDQNEMPTADLADEPELASDLEEEVSQRLQALRGKIKRKSSTKPEYSVEELSLTYGTSRRTLYSWLAKGKLKRANHGAASISESEVIVLERIVQKLREKRARRDTRKLLIDYYAERRLISRESARRHLDRQIERQGSAFDVAKKEGRLFTNWVKSRIPG
jgi:hypothetical protein